MENIENNNETAAQDLLNDEKRKFPFLRLIWFIAALACTLPYIWITIIHPPVHVSTISLSTYKAQLDGQPVYLTGMLESDEIIDPIFRFSAKALDLTRIVEVYEQDNSNLITGWRKLDATHVPTTSLPFASHKWETPKARIGIYEIDKTLLAYKNTSQQINLTSQNLLALNNYGQKAFKVFDGYFYYSADPTSPDLGDFRVSYFANSNQVISTIGIQKNETITPWQLDTEPLILTRAGDVSKEELLEQTDLSNVPYSKEIETYAPLAAAGFLVLLILSAIIVKIRNRRNQKKNASNFMTEDAQLANVDISDEELNIPNEPGNVDPTLQSAPNHEPNIDEAAFSNDAEEVSQIASELKEQAPEIPPSTHIPVDDIDDTPVMTMSPEQEENSLSTNEPITVDNVISEDIAPQIQTSDAPKQTQTSAALQEQAITEEPISTDIDNFELQVEDTSIAPPTSPSDNVATTEGPEALSNDESFAAMDEEFGDFEDNFEDDFSDFSDENDFEEGFDPPPVFQESESINVEIPEEDDELTVDNSHESMAAQLEETKELLEEALTPTDDAATNTNANKSEQANVDLANEQTEQVAEPEPVNNISDDLPNSIESDSAYAEQSDESQELQPETSPTEAAEPAPTETIDSNNEDDSLESDTDEAPIPQAENMDVAAPSEDTNYHDIDNNDTEDLPDLDDPLHDDSSRAGAAELDETEESNNSDTPEETSEYNHEILADDHVSDDLAESSADDNAPSEITEDYNETITLDLANEQAPSDADINDELAEDPIADDYDDSPQIEQPASSATGSAIDALNEEETALPTDSQTPDVNDSDIIDDAHEQFATNDEELFELAENEDDESSSTDIDYSVLSEEELIDKLEQAMKEDSDNNDDTEQEEFPTPDDNGLNDEEAYSDNVNLGGPNENDLMQALTGDRGPEIPKETEENEENDENDVPPAVYNENEEELPSHNEDALAAPEAPLENTINDPLPEIEVQNSNQTNNEPATPDSFEPIDDTSEDFLDDESFYDPFESATDDDSTIDSAEEEPIDTSPKI